MTPATFAVRAAVVAAVIVASAIFGLQFANLPPVGESQSPPPSTPEVVSPTPAPLAGCPAPPYTLGSIAAVPLADRPACFGDQELIITGWVIRLSNVVPPCELSSEPMAWLQCEQMQQPLAFGAVPPGPFAAASQLLWVTADPTGPVGQIQFGATGGQAVRTNTWVRVTGHFNDPRTIECGSVGSALWSDCAGTLVLTGVTEIEAAVPPPLWTNECIHPPVDILTVMVQTEPVACYGDTSLTLEGTLAWRPWTMEGGCVSLEPTWFSCLSDVTLTAVRPPSATSSIALAAVSTAFVRAAVHPSAGIAFGELEGRLVRVTGHFEDPAALSCTYGGAPTDGAVWECRNKLVFTEIVLLD